MLTCVTAIEPCGVSAVSIIVTDVGAAALGDELGVADERRVGELRRLLVHRHRDDPCDLAGERGVGRGGDVGACRCARRGVELARTVIGRSQQPGVDDAQRTGAHLARRLDRRDRHRQTEQLAAVLEDRDVAVDDGRAVAQRALGGAPQHDLGPDARGVAHRDRHRAGSHDRSVPHNRSARARSSPNPPARVITGTRISRRHEPRRARCDRAQARAPCALPSSAAAVSPPSTTSAARPDAFAATSATCACEPSRLGRRPDRRRPVRSARGVARIASRRAAQRLQRRCGVLRRPSCR